MIDRYPSETGLAGKEEATVIFYACPSLRKEKKARMSHALKRRRLVISLNKKPSSFEEKSASFDSTMIAVTHVLDDGKHAQCDRPGHSLLYVGARPLPTVHVRVPWFGFSKTVDL